jgi:hypothetical protein
MKYGKLCMPIKPQPPDILLPTQEYFTTIHEKEIKNTGLILA